MNLMKWNMKRIYATFKSTFYDNKKFQVNWKSENKYFFIIDR